MKITSLTVTDEHGTQYVWEGSGSLGAYHGTETGPVVTAVLLATVEPLLPVEGHAVSRSAVSGQFTTAEDAAEHPDTTVTEQL